MSLPLDVRCLTSEAGLGLDAAGHVGQRCNPWRVSRPIHCSARNTMNLQGEAWCSTQLSSATMLPAMMLAMGDILGE